MPHLRKIQITIDFYREFLSSFNGIKWLVKVTETFTDILNYYVLQANADKFAVHEKVYVVKKYLKQRFLV